MPRIDVLVSGTFQSTPGPAAGGQLQRAERGQVAPSLGRPLSGSAANVSVNLVEPGTLFGDRINQLDLRFAKVLTFGRTRDQRRRSISTTR